MRIRVEERRDRFELNAIKAFQVVAACLLYLVISSHEWRTAICLILFLFFTHHLRHDKRSVLRLKSIFDLETP